MRIPKRPLWDRVTATAKRPLVACLLAALLFELSLLAGVLMSPFFQDWLPHHGPSIDETSARLVRYRRSVAHRELDPRTGEPAPAIALQTLSGLPLGPGAFRGKKVALLFIRDGSG